MAQRLTVDRQEAERQIAEVERALAEGFRPPDGRHDSTHRNAITVAARRLKISNNTLHYRIGTPDEPGVFLKYFNLTVDWGKYKPAPPPELAPDEPKVILPLGDPIEIRKLKDENQRLKDVLRSAERRAAEAENVRAGILGLMEMPAVPVRFPPRDRGKGLAETVILFLSDLQWGEVVSLEAMDGINSFNLDIARKRLGRWANTVCDLLTKHWA